MPSAKGAKYDSLGPSAISQRADPSKHSERALPQKSKCSYWQWGFSSMPQRGYGLQPRVAASATLGTSKKRNFNRNAVASFSQREMHKANATALRLRTSFLYPG